MDLKFRNKDFTDFLLKSSKSRRYFFYKSVTALKNSKEVFHQLDSQLVVKLQRLTEEQIKMYSSSNQNQNNKKRSYTLISLFGDDDEPCKLHPNNKKTKDNNKTKQTKTNDKINQEPCSSTHLKETSLKCHERSDKKVKITHQKSDDPKHPKKRDKSKINSDKKDKSNSERDTNETCDKNDNSYLPKKISSRRNSFHEEISEKRRKSNSIESCSDVSSPKRCKESKSKYRNEETSQIEIPKEKDRRLFSSIESDEDVISTLNKRSILPPIVNSPYVTFGDFLKNKNLKSNPVPSCSTQKADSLTVDDSDDSSVVIVIESSEEEEESRRLSADFIVKRKKKKTRHRSKKKQKISTDSVESNSISTSSNEDQDKILPSSSTDINKTNSNISDEELDKRMTKIFNGEDLETSQPESSSSKSEVTCSKSGDSSFKLKITLNPKIMSSIREATSKQEALSKPKAICSQFEATSSRSDDSSLKIKISLKPEISSSKSKEISKPITSSSKSGATSPKSETSSKHKATSLKSEVTSRKPETTSSKPEASASKSGATSPKNDISSKSEESASKFEAIPKSKEICKPVTSSSKSGATSSKPEATFSKSVATSSKPEATASKPEAKTLKLEATASKSEATLHSKEIYKSKSTNSKPEASTSNSKAVTSKPEITSPKPESTSYKSKDISYKPKSSSSKPEATCSKPEATYSKPEIISLKLKEITNNPKVTSTKPESYKSKASSSKSDVSTKPEASSSKPKAIPSKHEATSSKLESSSKSSQLETSSKVEKSPKFKTCSKPEAPSNSYTSKYRTTSLITPEGSPNNETVTSSNIEASKSETSLHNTKNYKPLLDIRVSIDSAIGLDENIDSTVTSSENDEASSSPNENNLEDELSSSEYLSKMKLLITEKAVEYITCDFMSIFNNYVNYKSASLSSERDKEYFNKKRTKYLKNLCLKLKSVKVFSFKLHLFFDSLIESIKIHMADRAERISEKSITEFIRYHLLILKENSASPDDCSILFDLVISSRAFNYLSQKLFSFNYCSLDKNFFDIVNRFSIKLERSNSKIEVSKVDNEPVKILNKTSGNSLPCINNGEDSNAELPSTEPDCEESTAGPSPSTEPDGEDPTAGSSSSTEPDGEVSTAGPSSSTEPDGEVSTAASSSLTEPDNTIIERASVITPNPEIVTTIKEIVSSVTEVAMIDIESIDQTKSYLTSDKEQANSYQAMFDRFTKENSRTLTKKSKDIRILNDITITPCNNEQRNKTFIVKSNNLISSGSNLLENKQTNTNNNPMLSGLLDGIPLPEARAPQMFTAPNISTVLPQILTAPNTSTTPPQILNGPNISTIPLSKLPPPVNTTLPNSFPEINSSLNITTKNKTDENTTKPKPKRKYTKKPKPAPQIQQTLNPLVQEQQRQRLPTYPEHFSFNPNQLYIRSRDAMTNFLNKETTKCDPSMNFSGRNPLQQLQQMNNFQPEVQRVTEDTTMNRATTSWKQPNVVSNYNQNSVYQQNNSSNTYDYYHAPPNPYNMNSVQSYPRETNPSPYGYPIIYSTNGDFQNLPQYPNNFTAPNAEVSILDPYINNPPYPYQPIPRSVPALPEYPSNPRNHPIPSNKQPQVVQAPVTHQFNNKNNIDSYQTKHPGINIPNKPPRTSRNIRQTQNLQDIRSNPNIEQFYCPVDKTIAQMQQTKTVSIMTANSNTREPSTTMQVQAVQTRQIVKQSQIVQNNSNLNTRDQLYSVKTSNTLQSQPVLTRQTMTQSEMIQANAYQHSNINGISNNSQPIVNHNTREQLYPRTTQINQVPTRQIMKQPETSQQSNVIKQLILTTNLNNQGQMYPVNSSKQAQIKLVPTSQIMKQPETSQQSNGIKQLLPTTNLNTQGQIYPVNYSKQAQIKLVPTSQILKQSETIQTNTFQQSNISTQLQTTSNLLYPHNSSKPPQIKLIPTSQIMKQLETLQTNTFQQSNMSNQLQFSSNENTRPVNTSNQTQIKLVPTSQIMKQSNPSRGSIVNGIPNLNLTQRNQHQENNTPTWNIKPNLMENKKSTFNTTSNALINDLADLENLLKQGQNGDKPDQTDTVESIIRNPSTDSGYLSPNKQGQQEPPCARCLKDSQYYCSGCLIVYYCSFTCQNEAWPSHRNNCSYFNSNK